MVAPSGQSLQLQNIHKRYGNLTVVHDVNLTIKGGEFLTLLGPSGSGKSTLLNIIAGFSEPSEGRLLLNGKDITETPPEKRSFGMVFQGYALFPHMTVAENVAFPLMIRGMPKSLREQKVREALDLVQLARFAERRISQLSGGQQQRVALARALVFEPAVLLLDEPLSALDKKLRAELQEELKTLHERVGRTFINVTHDQDEALSMSDRIAILDHGRIVQYGGATELYERPSTRFVANFLGYSNFIEGKVVGHESDSFTVAKGAYLFNVAGRTAEDHVVLSLRPEKIEVNPTETAVNSLRGKVKSWSYLGSEFSLTLDVADLGPLKLSIPSWKADFAPQNGMELVLGWSPDALVPVAEVQA